MIHIQSSVQEYQEDQHCSYSYWPVCMIIFCVLVLALLFFSPVSPDRIDWSELYPVFCKSPRTTDDECDDFKDELKKQRDHQVEFADIGCGYGGLLGNNCGSKTLWNLFQIHLINNDKNVGLCTFVQSKIYDRTELYTVIDIVCINLDNITLMNLFEEHKIACKH